MFSFFRFENPTAQVAWSLTSRCYPRQRAAAERSMSWMVTQLYRDVASHPTRSRPAARLSVARPQSAGAGSALETKRGAIDAHLSVDTICRLQQQQKSVTLCLKTKYYDRLTHVAHSARLFAARSEAVRGARTLGSSALCSALGASLRGARPRQQQLVAAFTRISARTINPFFFG